MKLELVSIATDAEALDGIFYTPDRGDIVAAAMIFHGNCLNFYSGPSRFLPEVLVSRGIACLAFNRRGHDMVAFLSGRDVGGGSFQLASEGIADNTYAAEWLAARGFQRPIVIGHSNGGMLGVRHCVEHPDTRALVLMSAHLGGRTIVARNSAAGLLAKDRVAEITAQAEKMVAAGRGRELILLPGWWWVISAESFLDRLYKTPDILEDAPKVRCPTLYLRGDKEIVDVYPAEAYAARAGGPCEARILPDCDHFYSGHETEVATAVADWLTQTCKL
jgi:pimeloyl-ACP methyl ester carboxylesterase